MRALVAPTLLLLATVCVFERTQAAPPLEQELRSEDPAVLASAARDQGDAARGAIVFHQQALTCTKCHGSAGESSPLGPDLAKLGKDVPDTSLIESILDPSKSIAKGFETLDIATKDGKTVSGLLAEDRADAVVVRDPKQNGRLVTVAKADIEERTRSAQSLMPAGLANQLGSRQQFLDLIRYLREIADHGPARARALRPDPALLAPPPVPEYEKDIDHARLIAELGPASRKRGEAIYARVCANCHGTKEQPGSLPTSLRFASGTFRNGSDPYSMYRTLTYGFGQMVPQTWMVPRQKYDVIHYIREAYLKSENPAQYVPVNRAYLGRLPRGRGRGPEPARIEPWVSMDYGPSLMATYEVGDKGENFAYKGIAVRLDPGPGGVSRGRAWVVYDHDTMRLAGAWTGAGFIDWNSIHFNGRHEIHPRIVGQVILENPNGPGWAGPDGAGFDDPRPRGRDGRPYGRLPHRWTRFRGLHAFEHQVILSYLVGDAPVLEMPGFDDKASVFRRTLNIGPRRTRLVMRVARESQSDVHLRPVELGGPSTFQSVVFARDEQARAAPRASRPGFLLTVLSPPVPGARWSADADGDVRLELPAGDAPLKFTIRACRVASEAAAKDLLTSLVKDDGIRDLDPLTRGGPPRWRTMQTTRAMLGDGSGTFAVDELPLPENNPWFAQLRLTGFDFLSGGHQAAVCTWDGDVWRVDGVDQPEHGLSWTRIASGLFQPLGLKVVDGLIYVSCRDQIVRLHDRNGDGEIDFYENFNSDHQVTEHFHEFEMDLQTDAEGRFYYTKAARHGKTALVPQHGTLLRVTKDGAHTDILATGFRAPNGVCLNSDGTFFLSDQEGFWIPKNRINWVKEGGFYGNMWGYHDVTDTSDSAMEPPVCWITNAFDRSPAQLLWVESAAWGPLKGALLSLSYGNGKVFLVPHEPVDGRVQGGMVALPIPPFPTGVMRGRFHPVNGHLYACGMYAWAGDRTQPGGFYRIRYTRQTVSLPVGLSARRRGMAITFSGPLDRGAAADATRYSAMTWSLKRTESYGSKHFDERVSPISAATLSDDGRTVLLEMPKIRPTWCMEIKYDLKDADGQPVTGVIDNTIHALRD